MKTINLSTTKHRYDAATKTFTFSELDLGFASRYSILNPATGVAKEFNFSHSTGPEFDPNTKWVYKSEDGLIIEVVNDPQMTKVLC